jgi:hypothetical protein
MGDRWSDVAAIPDDGVLLHIGPFKTGTTAIQEALASSRPELADHGVTWPGTQLHTRAAMSAIRHTFGWSDRGGATAPRRDWRELLTEVRAAPGRVVVSSEYFCLAKPRRIERIWEQLGQGRVHVLVTLRPLGLLLPSTWQQYVKSGKSIHYEDWLRAVLADPPDRTVTPWFWVRNDHLALVRRWVEVVGTDRLTVLVLDDADRGMLYDVFERLLALPLGTLNRVPNGRANRSLSAVECELLRTVNEEVERHDVPWGSYVEVVRNGAVRRLVDSRDPAPGEARITTPDWALARAAQLGVETAAGLAGTGVRIIGDVDRLGTRTAPVAPQPPETVVPVTVAADLLLGALSGSMRAGPRFGTPGPAWPPVKEVGLAKVPTPELVATLGSRVRGSLRRRASRLARAVPGRRRAKSTR